MWHAYNTYGIERLAMYLQGVENVYDLVWTERVENGVTKKLITPMIWPMLSRRCTRVSCRAAATVCSGGMRPTGHPT